LKKPLKNSNSMKTILITGGTGLVGRRLSERLLERGYTVLHVGRKRNLDKKPFPCYAWDDLRNGAVPQVDGVVHLAGAGIADGRWTASRRREIIASRVDTLGLLCDALAKLPEAQRPQVVVSASATGIYGDSGERPCPESATAPHDNFMTETCRLWEAAAQPIQALGIRLVTPRIGIVLTPQGGALAKMLPSYQFRLGAYFGNGQQWYPWIHLDDLCDLLIFVIETPEAKGVYNATAPHPERNITLAREIPVALGKRALVLPVPRFALRLALGQMADVVLLSCRADSSKIQQAGFQFSYPRLPEALRALVR
jgi:hypothetical protein